MSMAANRAVFLWVTFSCSHKRKLPAAAQPMSYENVGGTPKQEPQRSR
jgi:hypothetical protein